MVFGYLQESHTFWAQWTQWLKSFLSTPHSSHCPLAPPPPPDSPPPPPPPPLLLSAPPFFPIVSIYDVTNLLRNVKVCSNLKQMLLSYHGSDIAIFSLNRYFRRIRYFAESFLQTIECLTPSIF